MTLRGFQPGSHAYIRAIVAAQMLAQIGAFALPALLPGDIARWDLSITEAGLLVGIFFAAYVVMVPLLVALTDRVPVWRVYMLGTGLTALSHFGFALFADGFWSALLLRMLAGIGWAGTYMPGLKAIADPLEGTSQSAAVTRPAAGIAFSITGNETAQRWGRGRVVTVAMSTAVVLSLLTGWSAGAPAVLAALLVVLWNAAIYFDSSALTAGTVQAADKELRGATMGLHSMCGYAGGFIGPLGVGLVLD